MNFFPLNFWITRLASKSQREIIPNKCTNAMYTTPYPTTAMTNSFQEAPGRQVKPSAQKLHFQHGELAKTRRKRVTKISPCLQWKRLCRMLWYTCIGSSRISDIDLTLNRQKIFLAEGAKRTEPNKVSYCTWLKNHFLNELLHANPWADLLVVFLFCPMKGKAVLRNKSDALISAPQINHWGPLRRVAMETFQKAQSFAAMLFVILSSHLPRDFADSSNSINLPSRRDLVGWYGIPRHATALARAGT